MEIQPKRKIKKLKKMKKVKIFLGDKSQLLEGPGRQAPERFKNSKI